MILILSMFLAVLGFLVGRGLDFRDYPRTKALPKMSLLSQPHFHNEAAADVVGVRDEIGSVEGTLSDVGTHYNYPAAKIIDTRNKKEVWCRLTVELQEEFQDKATYKDVWQHRRVLVSGRIKYDKNSDLLYVVASDIRRIEPREVSLEAIKDPNFTSGLPIGEYLDRFRDGTPGLVTTKELNEAMDQALANGWQPTQKPLENAPLAIASPFMRTK